MGRQELGCCYSQRIRWCSWTTKSPQVITAKRKKAGRTKLLTSTPRRKLSPLLMTKPFLWGNFFANSIFTAHSHHGRNEKYPFSSALTLCKVKPEQMSDIQASKRLSSLSIAAFFPKDTVYLSRIINLNKPYLSLRKVWSPSGALLYPEMVSKCKKGRGQLSKIKKTK